MTGSPKRILVVDLNIFARYPTLSVGYLIASLRRSGYEVELVSPLAKRLPTVPERTESLWDHVQRRAYFSTHPVTVRAHNAVASIRRRWVSRPETRLREATAAAIDARRPDIVLISSYLDYRSACEQVVSLAATRGIPVILGGPAFNAPETARDWLRIPGLTALVGAEVDLSLSAIVEAVLGNGDIGAVQGVYLPDGRHSGPAPPLKHLDLLPCPDFSNFPWQMYPNRIVPVMTGRGCSWGACTFCSDVRVVNGRTFRSRPLAAVMDELTEQCGRYETRDVIFLDIKLNSDLSMWRGLIEQFPRRLPEGRWIGTVHVQDDSDNGLGRDDLRAAALAGLTRLSFGLESGSDRLNALMAKGTSTGRMSQFLHDAHAADISVRATAILGYPGEEPDDIEATTRFLTEHEHCLDRIRINRFSPMLGTRFYDAYERTPDRFRGLVQVRWDHRSGRTSYRYDPASARSYRRAKARLLRKVFDINRRPLRARAAAFDGVM